MNLKYVIDLAAKNEEALGFIPNPRLEWYWDRGQILLETENDEPCGYLLFGHGWPELKIFQACIQYDARRRKHGFNLVRRLLQYAIRKRFTSISLWCADDLEANDFWQEAGFKFAAQKQGGNRRGRILNRWVYWLPEPLEPTLLPPEKMIQLGNHQVERPVYSPPNKKEVVLPEQPALL